VARCPTCILLVIEQENLFVQTFNQTLYVDDEENIVDNSNVHYNEFLNSECLSTIANSKSNKNNFKKKSNKKNKSDNRENVTYTNREERCRIYASGSNHVD